MKIIILILEDFVVILHEEPIQETIDIDHEEITNI